MRTRVTEMLGIEFPLLAFTHCRDVAAAVSAAGGLGVLGAVAHSPEQLAVDLKWIREHAGGKPFGVDLLIPRKYAGSNEGGLGVEDLRGMIPDEHRKWIDDLLERYIDRDQSKRDQGFSQQSFDDFAELVKRYPDSRYAADARQRMIFLRNNMARAELNIALYYLRREAYVASANRAEHIVQVYQGTPQAADALAVMAESYKRLGQDKLSDDARRVLELHAPDHPYLAGHWPAKRHYWKRLVPFINRG